MSLREVNTASFRGKLRFCDEEGCEAHSEQESITTCPPCGEDFCWTHMMSHSHAHLAGCKCSEAPAVSATFENRVAAHNGFSVERLREMQPRPLVKGGQGRHADEMSFSGRVVAWAAVVLIALFLIGIALNLAGRL